MMSITDDPWLAALLGRPAFRVDVDSGGSRAALIDAIRAHAGAQREAMYYAKVPTADVGTIQALGEVGFSVADTNVTLRHQGPRPDRSGRACDVHMAAPGEYEPILDVAGSAFRYSRFHLDPVIPLETAHRIKRAWVESYVRGTRGDRLFAAVDGARPVGFLAALTTMREEQTVAVIDLVGVRVGLERRGIGRALVTAFLEAYAESAAWCEVGTQAANIPSLRLYEGLGFSIVRSDYVLHRHLRPSA